MILKGYDLDCFEVDVAGERVGKIRTMGEKNNEERRNGRYKSEIIN